MLTNNSQAWLPNRRLRVCVWNPTPAMAGASALAIEQQLKNLGSIQLVHLKALDDQELHPCDLLVLPASYIEEETFVTWLKGIESRLARQGGIKIPAMIYAHIALSVQRELLQWAVASNWYFDIVDPDHLSSLPIRIANFLRLHDHLHEVARMQTTVENLSERITTLENNLNQAFVARTDDTP